MRRIAFAAGILIALRADAQQPARWLATWAPSPFAAAPRPSLDSVDRVPTYSDRTVRQIVRTTLGGDRLRIRFTNEHGERPLVIGAAHVAIRDTGATIRTGTDKTITFGGRTSVTLGRCAMIVSDAVDMHVPALSDIAISIWVQDTIRAATRHALGLQTNADSNSRWPDVLARRLLTSKQPAMAVVNAGISGNGVLSPITGPSALARFDRDVLMQPGVTHVILLEGINDLGRGVANTDLRNRVSAQDLIFGYQQLIARAHERGLLIFGGTLTPMANMTRPTTAAVDSVRRVVNEWIRTSGAFDGVIDFDAATRDPSQPDRFLPRYDSGDHLHPGDAGYRAMGESIDLSLFRRARPAPRP